MLTATTSLPLSRTLFRGNTTSFAYDEAARLTGLIDSKGNSMKAVRRTMSMTPAQASHRSLQRQIRTKKKPPGTRGDATGSWL